ncbi:MAG: hypothetical protein FWD39_05965, partial [Clostridiales bacterium]|nr:hypothetical protein [Clostridiales bacterium]
IGLAVAVALFVGGFFLFRLREKNMKRLLPPFLFMLLGPFLLGALFSSGFFGWSYYVPKASQVEEMEISYRGLDGISILHSGNGSWGGNAIYGYENIRQVLLTDPADIEKGLAAHKALSSSRGGRLGGEITVAYKLKNGRTVYRYYKSANVNALKVFLELDNTKEVDAILAYLLTGGKAPRSYTTQNIAVRERGWSATLQPPGNLLDENIPLTLIYPWGQEEAFALNLAQRVQLGETLLRELRAQTLEQRYFPAEQEVVTLRIDRRNNYESFLLNLALSRGQFGETLALLEQWGWLPEWERPEIEFALVDPFSKLLKRGYYSRPPAVLYVNQLIYVALMPGYGESYYNYLFREFQKISDGFEKVNDAAKVRALYESSVTQMHISQPGAAAVWFKIAGEETYFCRYVSGSDLKAILR